MDILRRIAGARAEFQTAIGTTFNLLVLLGVLNLTDAAIAGVNMAIGSWLVLAQRVAIGDDLDSLAGAIDSEVRRQTDGRP
jgi:hypothetical protein